MKGLFNLFQLFGLHSSCFFLSVLVFGFIIILPRLIINEKNEVARL